MNKELFEKIKSAVKNIDNDIKNNEFPKNDIFNLSDSEKLKFKELFNSGKKFVKEKFDEIRKDEINNDVNDASISSNDTVDENNTNSDKKFSKVISEAYKKVNEKVKQEMVNYNKKYAKDKIEDLVKTGIDYGKTVKEEIKRKIAESDSNTSKVKSYDNKLSDRITEYSNRINEIRMLVVSYLSLNNNEKRNLYDTLYNLFKESKQLISIYNELSDSEKEKYYSLLKFPTLNLYSIIYMYNNSYDHSKYNDYIRTFDLYDEIIDHVDDKIIGITGSSIHLFSKYLYNKDGYIKRYDGLKEKANRVCIYESDDDFTAIYMDNGDNKYREMPNGYSYKASSNIIYTANCSLNYIMDFNRTRYEMYNENLVIPAYYENDKTTKNELDSVLKYISSKYNINNKEKIK